MGGDGGEREGKWRVGGKEGRGKGWPTETAGLDPPLYMWHP